jgi:predicted  nucleic acid-binding Zn-ribbon protein
MEGYQRQLASAQAELAEATNARAAAGLTRAEKTSLTKKIRQANERVADLSKRIAR